METKAKIELGNTTSIDENIIEWANGFYKAKKVEKISEFTLIFYKQQLGHFLKFCDAMVVSKISQVDSNFIREYLLWLEENDHNPGGLHAAYRVLKTFLRWFDLEAEPDGWRNPIIKVKAPKLDEEPLDPVEIEIVEKMIAACKGEEFLDIRDKAVLSCLLDSGARAREFLSMRLDDLDLISGEILIRKGKGGKPRTVFIEKQARKALRSYLNKRNDKNKAIWVTEEGEVLGYSGLRGILEKRSSIANVEMPTAHSFRRACAIRLLRRKIDLMIIAKILGHSNLKTLKRYLKILPDDVREAYRSAVDW